MDCIVLGNVPVGAGLSSSSALLVAFAQAAVALNGLRIEVSDFVDLLRRGRVVRGVQRRQHGPRRDHN